jgi:hypothetical protein
MFVSFAQALLLANGEKGGVCIAAAPLHVFSPDFITRLYRPKSGKVK